MAITPKCDICKDELKTFGAILLSPPDSKSKTLKFHICPDCYKKIIEKFKLKISSTSTADKKVLK